MRHVDEYRDRAAVEAVVKRIHTIVTRPWTHHGGLRRPDALPS